LLEPLPSLDKVQAVQSAKRGPSVQGMAPVLGRLVDRLGRSLVEPKRNGIERFRPSGGEPSLDLRFPFRQLLAMNAAPLGSIDGNQRRPATGQDAIESVKVGLADWVEFVVVAAGAGHRQAQKRLANDVDLVVGERHLLVERVGGGVTMLYHPKMGRAQGRLVDAELAVDPRVGQQIAGQVLANESIVGDVGIESANEIVAVAPSMGNGRVAFAAVRFGGPE